MTSIRLILVPTDFSDNAANAFCYALRMAEKINCEVKVIHVVYPDYDMGMDFPVVAAQVTEEKLQVAREVMATFFQEGIRAVFQDPQGAPAVTTEVIPGMPVETISRQCEKEKPDLIVMGTRGRHNRWTQWVGTVAAGIVQYAPANVLVVPAEATYRPMEKIACATELQAADLFQIWKVAQLLRDYSPSLFCVHVKTDGNGHTAIQPADLESFFQTNMPSIELRFFEVEGYDAEQSLNDFSHDQDVDLLVLFKPYRGLLERLLHKSLTRQLAIHCSLPLLVMKEGEGGDHG